ncbi:MAG: putative isochorismatase [Proteobacteria bacterium]|nr:putative isochorismatase [Pseudomonadota bacterium]
MSICSTDKGLLTPQNCAIVFIDHQAGMLLGVAETDRRALLNNVLILAKAARIFAVPVVLSASASPLFSGDIVPQLSGLFPDLDVIKHSSINAWECTEFVTAIRRTGRQNVLIAALWSEASLVFPALQMMEEGYYIYVVANASGGISTASQEAAIRRLEQAGAVSLSAVQVLLEFQRDWARSEHRDEVVAVLSEHREAGAQRAGNSDVADGVSPAASGAEGV